MSNHKGTSGPWQRQVAAGSHVWPPATGCLLPWALALGPPPTAPPCPSGIHAGLPSKAFAVLPQEGKNCSFTCGLKGLAPVSGGDPSEPLCMVITRGGALANPPNTTLYGV